MREIRPSGSEGGGDASLSLPLSVGDPQQACFMYPEGVRSRRWVGRVIQPRWG